jgi:HTH-type transcriptional regulator / antitoxin HipB
MIQNERQYKVTQTKLKDLQNDLAAMNPPDPSLHPRQVATRKKSLGILIGELEKEIIEYDYLKSGQVNDFPINSIEELPIIMIKARIVRGMTQKDLAEKIGVQEQQIQRYEANHYYAVGFDRLQEILSALDITFSQAVINLRTTVLPSTSIEQNIFGEVTTSINQSLTS